MKTAAFLPLALLTFLISCSSGTDSHSPDTSQGADGGELQAVKSDTARIITLPTPMQIPALLKNTRAHYRKDILMPIEDADKPFFKSNILFGMYMIDLAYASSFSDRQTSRAYFQKCRDLGNEMGLNVKTDRKLVTRFESNLERPDSLGRIILEMYDHGHLYFQQQDKAGIGLLMIMGCYFEGLHMCFAQAQEHDLILFAHILQQQRQYADNLVYALEAYEIPAEVRPEYDMLVRADQLLQHMNLPTVYNLKTGNSAISDINIEAINNLKEITAQFRQSVVI